VAYLNPLKYSKKIMKKVFIISLVLISTRASFAQTSTSKVEQYCQIIASPGLFSNRVTIDIDFGEEKSIWRDNRLKTYDGRLKKFNTVIDALNYMGKDGWIFMNAYPVSIGASVIYHFALKKEFPVSDVQK
jgi:hypothetical protein